MYSKNHTLCEFETSGSSKFSSYEVFILSFHLKVFLSFHLRLFVFTVSIIKTSDSQLPVYCFLRTQYAGLHTSPGTKKKKHPLLCPTNTTASSIPAAQTLSSQTWQHIRTMRCRGVLSISTRRPSSSSASWKKNVTN